MKRIFFIVALFISSYAYAQTWSLVGDNGNGIQVYCNAASIQQGFGFMMTFDVKEHIRDTVIAGVPQFVDRFITYRCYPDTVSFKTINIAETYPAVIWTESASSDFQGLDFPTILANVVAIKPTPVIHP